MMFNMFEPTKDADGPLIYIYIYLYLYIHTHPFENYQKVKQHREHAFRQTDHCAVQKKIPSQFKVTFAKPSKGANGAKWAPLPVLNGVRTIPNSL